MPSVHSLSLMHACIVTQRCQHGRSIIQAMLKTQALGDQFLDHLALQRGHSRGQYHRLLIALLESMETVQQRFALLEALPCSGGGILGHKAGSTIAVHHHPADTLPGEHRLNHLYAHICRQTPHGSTKIDWIAY